MFDEIRTTRAQQRADVIDETEKDKSVAPVQYDITSFGADYLVDGLIRRLQEEEIYIPHFQRGFVWTIRDASRFIESLLLGLPVPGIFMARDESTKKHLVIDGQQRLKTLQFFVEGFFNPLPDAKTRRVFRLQWVLDKFKGLTFDQLKEDDRRILLDSIIHSTIVRQESPQDDNTAIYHIFERLNTSGRKLSPQQIRRAIYPGPFIQLIEDLNATPSWREIYGNYSNVLKDQELILRFLAMTFEADNYRRPMKEFLNRFAIRSRNADSDFLADCEHTFISTIDFVLQSIGPRAFRPERALNAAVFDSVMVALALLLRNNPNLNGTAISEAYHQLLQDESYRLSISQATSDERNVEFRLNSVYDSFRSINA